VLPHLRNIGIVFQHYALFPHMTAAENIAFGLQMRKRSRADIAGGLTRCCGW
jgi:ABC-type Fe3+/spermidine/putrescine transport system ATPase subunit